jgi:hypothetical protein
MMARSLSLEFHQKSELRLKMLDTLHQRHRPSPAGEEIMAAGVTQMGFKLI